jgi:hypothetical protein
MPNPKVLELLLVKVDRAHKHISDLENAMADFRHNGPVPFQIPHEDNTQTGERTFYLSVNREIPVEWSALIGDICQNLRSALDHLAWHLVTSSPVTPKAKEKDIYFPIFESASEYKAKKMTKIKGMTDAAIRAIDEVEPYYRPEIEPGIGKGVQLFCLHEINRLDKHRLLIPTWVCMVGHTPTRTRRSEMKDVLINALGSADADVIVGAVSIDPGPLGNGSKLCTLPISEVDSNMKFRLHIGFGQPRWVKGKEISSTLSSIHQKVKETIISFNEQGLL